MSRTGAPVLLPCPGTSGAGLTVARVARELAGRGLAEVVDDVEQVVAAARQGREVLALDGCASSCQARLLDAHGVRGLRSLNLADRAHDVAAVSSVAELEAAAVPVTRGRRPPDTPPEPAERRQHNLDEYLLAIDALTAPVAECGTVVDAPTVASHIARLLHVSRPTAGEMLGRLEHEGLVRRGARKDVLLTAKGRARADGLLRKQQILECFVVDMLGYSPAECYDEAQRLVAGLGDEPVERMWAALGRPDRCPHGSPLDPADARRSARGMRSLAAVPRGAAVTVDRLDEHAREGLRFLVAAGLEPGARVSDVSHDPTGGGVSFTVAGAKRTIESRLASAVLVR